MGQGQEGWTSWDLEGHGEFIGLSFCLFLATPHSMWGLSSSTRDQTRYSTIRHLATSIWLPQRRQRHPAPVLLPGKSHERRSLEGCSLWGRCGSDTAERLHFLFSLSCIGEGNGNPLQCSCLENPRDGGAWWAAVYGVKKNHVAPPSSQDEALSRYSASGEVPR